MAGESAQTDGFVRDRLPPRDHWPDLLFERPELAYPERMNAVTRLLEDGLAEGHGERVAVYNSAGNWTYADLLDRVNRIANVLRRDMALEPGNRVLLRGPNSPMTAAAWLAVLKAGGIAVATMPLQRAGELAAIADKAQISHALVDTRLMEPIAELQAEIPALGRVMTFEGGELEERMGKQAPVFEAVDTLAEDIALIAFTSGTSGAPKGCVHFHRDVLAMVDTFSRHILRPGPGEVHAGTPPLAFTFGLGGLLVFPLAARAATVLDEVAGPQDLVDAMAAFSVTTSFTSPTGYRAMLPLIGGHGLASLKKGVSAGEPLPAQTAQSWLEATGIRLIDGIGATEMMHIFISAAPEEARPGATGKPVPGFEARVVDDNLAELPPGRIGRLAVRGPTGCRYLDDSRQRDYVREGWNVTGDAFLVDADGYFWFQARNDDLILSGGYNIAGPEVEGALLSHAAVAECAVVGAPDAARGQIVKAFIVLAEGFTGEEGLIGALQRHVKGEIAPYKYPRVIEFVEALPKTETGKIQRFKLRR